MEFATAREPSRVDGDSTVDLIPGDPVRNVRSPKMFDTVFERIGIDTVPMPMQISERDFTVFSKSAFLARNVGGALVTMPHEVVTVGPMDEVTPTARIAGACNAILKRPEGTLRGDRFDAAVFAQGVVHVGADELLEPMPAYPDFFGFGTTAPEELRALAHSRCGPEP